MEQFDEWFADRMRCHHFEIERIPFRELQQWSFDDQFGHLKHASGKFFRIEGIQVETNFGPLSVWNQPIINQPEVGFLGFIVKRFDGVPHFLMQAKMEPGNIRCIQLAPTLQATKSNYMRVHQGKSPPLLEFFRDRRSARVVVDSLQSEQGGRFLRKRNRNIVIELPVDEPIPENPDYIWLTLPQIHQLLRRDNVINMDARTVLSCLPLGYAEGEKGGSAESTGEDVRGLEDVLSWFTELKCRYELSVRSLPLNETDPWVIGEDRIFHPSGNFFEVVAVSVEADNREVGAWTQPLLKPCREGIVAFVVKRQDNDVHFLMQAKVEAGNFDILEMAPTVQCLTGDYRKAGDGLRPPFLDYVLQAQADAVLFDTKQSEEGGRFYREENRNLIVKADRHFDEHLPENYAWVSLRKLKALMRFNNIVNVQARCLLSAVSPDLLEQVA
jgi:oxidase EvaA